MLKEQVVMENTTYITATPCKKARSKRNAEPADQQIKLFWGAPMEGPFR